MINLTDVPTAGTAQRAYPSCEPVDLAAFLHARGRVAMLVGGTPQGRAQATSEISGKLGCPVVAISNKLNSPLTLHRILFQAGGTGADEDKALGLTRALEARADAGLVLLAITDAQTLDPDALRTLVDLASEPSSKVKLLLSGPPTLLHATASPGLGTLADGSMTAILHLTDVAEAPMLGQERRASPISVMPKVLRLIGLGALVAFALMAGARLNRPEGKPDRPEQSLPGPSATDRDRDAKTVTQEPVAVAGAAPAPPPMADPVPPLPAETAPIPPAVTQPPPFALLDEGQMRRDFDVFLDRAGRDTAALTSAARAALFEEYLLWRSRNVGKVEPGSAPEGADPR